MTASRHIIPGSTYMLTRRCHERRYFMAPSNAELVNAMYYILAEAAQKHAIDLHVGTFMSNHHHTEFTDPNGVAPRFAAHSTAIWPAPSTALAGAGTASGRRSRAAWCGCATPKL